jgi:hypothetical protein
MHHVVDDIAGTEEEAKALEEGGNTMAKVVYESKIKFDEKIFPSCDQGVAVDFVYKKYVLKAWFNQSAASNFVCGTKGILLLKGHKSDVVSISQHTSNSETGRAAKLGYEYDSPLSYNKTPQSDAVRRRYLRRASLGSRQGSSNYLVEDIDSKDANGFIVTTSSHGTMEDFNTGGGFYFNGSFGCDSFDDPETWWDESNDVAVASLKAQDEPPINLASRGPPTRRRRRRSIGEKETPPATPTRRQGDGLLASVHDGCENRMGARVQRRGMSDPDLTHTRTRTRGRSMTNASKGNVRRISSDPLLFEAAHRFKQSNSLKDRGLSGLDGDYAPQRRGSNERCIIDDCVNKTSIASDHSPNLMRSNQQPRRGRSRRGSLTGGSSHSRPRSSSSHSSAFSRTGSRSSRPGSRVGSSSNILKASGHSQSRSSSNHSRTATSPGHVHQAVTQRSHLPDHSTEFFGSSSLSSRSPRSVSNERNEKTKKSECNSPLSKTSSHSCSRSLRSSRSSNSERNKIAIELRKIGSNGEIRERFGDSQGARPMRRGSIGKSQDKRLTSGGTPGPLVRNRDKSLLKHHLKNSMDSSSHTKATMCSDTSSGSSTDAQQSDKPLSLACIFQAG